MRCLSVHFAALLLSACALAVQAVEEPPPSGARVYPEVTGAALYVEYCAVCHGSDGRGDGPLAGGLTTAPSDLRRLRAANGGIFPRERVRLGIDGRELAPMHGSREMPVWGQVFRRSRGADGERRVQQRLDRLLDYLETLQIP